MEAASQMASNAKDTITNATAAARDTIAQESQTTASEVQGLPASTQRAGDGSNSHPLTKYHSFLHDTVTWKFPRASAIAFFLIVSSILASHFIHFSRFIFRILWLSFASTATIEAISKLVTGRGIVSSGLKPRRYYQINKNVFDSLLGELANVTNFLVLEFQRLLFAEKTSHTAAAFLISFIAYKLVRYIPLWSLALMGTVFAFAAPPLYLRNQEIIDKHILQAQNLAAEKAAYARNMAEAQVGAVSERAKVVTSEWGKKAGIELPWSPTKTSPPVVPASTAAPGKAPVQGSSTGIETLQGLNVPQSTPQKRVEPHNVPLPDTPAQVAQ